MHTGHSTIRTAFDRRVFLAAGSLGFAGLHVPALAGPHNRRSKSSRVQVVIFHRRFFSDGRHSRLDRHFLCLVERG
jgi:hypothetical protein